MIKSMIDGSKITAKAYARQLVAAGVQKVRDAGCQDEEMTQRELDLVVGQLAKITDRLLAKLNK